MQEIIRVSDVEKYYGNGDQVTKAVDRVSFAVQQGEFIGVMGASGSGKTTEDCSCRNQWYRKDNAFKSVVNH